MATRRTGKAQGRPVGQKAVRRATGLTEVQQIWLGLLVAYCLTRDTAVFVGTPTSTGSVRLNVYPPDDRCQGSLALLEDWSVEIPALLSDVFEEDITEADLVRAAPWAARKLAEAPGDIKPTLRPSDQADVPQRLARRTTEA